MKRALFLAVAVLLSGAAFAQDYPTKPITVIVPAAAGGPSDTLTRVLAQQMGDALKQQMIIENVGGAGGTIGIARAAKARNDGYTLLMYHIGMATSPALYRKLQYDTLNDFDYIGEVADLPMMLIAKKTTAANNFAEFLSYAKANNDKLTYANAGLGSASYLCGILFMSAIDAKFTMVPYKGTGPAMNDLIGGQVDFMCDQTPNTVPQVKSGTVKAYGVTTAQRIASMPDIPTLDEQGLKGFNLVVWNGLFAPKGMPRPVQDKLVAALQTAVQAQAFKARLADLGAEAVPVSKANPGSLAKLLKSEVEKWDPIIKKTGQFAD